MSSTLVYIASGGYKEEYENLNYDRVFLVDASVRRRFRSNKVKLLRCDAMEAIEYFKKELITIDCLVTLCESIAEGGHTYATCSDTFMGYIMPILAKDFLWICNDIGYYPPQYHSSRGERIVLNGKSETLYKMRTRYGYNFVSFDLPYAMREIRGEDPLYLSPLMFSDELSNEKEGHVFKMHYSPSYETVELPGGVPIRLIQDSIWNHYNELDHLFVSFKLGYPPKKDYFDRIDKVSYYEQMDFGEKLSWAKSNGFGHIGFTPHYWYQYDKNYQKPLEDFILGLEKPMTIDFYYLNTHFGIRFIKKAIKTILR